MCNNSMRSNLSFLSTMHHSSRLAILEGSDKMSYRWRMGKFMFEIRKPIYSRLFGHPNGNLLRPTIVASFPSTLSSFFRSFSQNSSVPRYAVDVEQQLRPGTPPHVRCPVNKRFGELKFSYHSALSIAKQSKFSRYENGTVTRMSATDSSARRHRFVPPSGCLVHICMLFTVLHMQQSLQKIVLDCVKLRRKLKICSNCLHVCNQ